MPVQGEGAIRLTTARYYTPSGRSIQALGVAPDIIVEQRLPEEAAAEEPRDPQPRRALGGRPARVAGERLADRRTRRRSSRRTGSSKEETARLRAEDYQLSYAIDILRGMSYLAAENEPADPSDRGGDPGAALPALRRAHAGEPRRGGSSPGSGSTTPSPPGRCRRAGSTRARRRATAALRELVEETGIPPTPVEVVAETPDWITYDLPHELVPRIWKGRFRGQKQRWFLMRFARRRRADRHRDAPTRSSAHGPGWRRRS